MHPFTVRLLVAVRAVQQYIRCTCGWPTDNGHFDRPKETRQRASKFRDIACPPPRLAPPIHRVLSQWPLARLHDTSRCFASRSGDNVVTFKKPDKVRISDNEVRKQSGCHAAPLAHEKGGPSSHSAVGSPRQKRLRSFSVCCLLW